MSKTLGDQAVRELIKLTGALPPGLSEKKYYYLDKMTPGTYKAIPIDRLFIIKAKLRKLKNKVKSFCGKFNKDIL